MAGNATGDGGGTIASINVTPLVDVVLVLLIIFLVTAKLVVAPGAALPLTLPRSSTGEGVTSVFAVSMPVDGSIKINGQPVLDDASLIRAGRSELQQHPELRAVIQADQAVPHGRVVHVMDLLGQAGISRIAFAVTLQRTAPGGR